MIPLDERDILTSLHYGPLEKPLWNTFLERLRRRVGAAYCGMYFRQGDAHITDSTEIAVGSSYPDDVRAQYNAGFHALDPIPYDDLRPGRVYSISEFISPSDPRHEKYMQDFIIPGERQFMRVMRVSAAGGYNAWLTIWRNDKDFSAADCSFLADIARHLEISLELYATIERERIRAGISGDAVKRLNFGWLTLDAQGHVLDMDDQAEELLKHSTVLRLRARQRLVPASREADRLLTEALRDFSVDAQARPRAVRLSDDPWLDMLLLPVRARKLSGPARPVLTAYLHGDRGMTAERVEQFMQLFGLTRSEARLALSLSRGCSIAEAAEELGISEQTARSYSKIVYGKTGARGQPDLIRIILMSAATLA